MAHNTPMSTRIYCPQENLAPGAHVVLPAVAAHHVAQVLRCAEGASLTLFDGLGGEWTAVITRIRKDDVQVVLTSFDDIERESRLAITLVQALPAADKMDWIVQKCTELGVAKILPVISKRSVVRLSGERMERRVRHWQGVAAAACEQCGRNRVPDVGSLDTLTSCLSQLPEEPRFILAPQSAQSLSKIQCKNSSLTLLVGPEGGFEEGEYQAAASIGFQPVTLGSRILRTETAGLAAIAMMTALWDNF